MGRMLSKAAPAAREVMGGINRGISEKAGKDGVPQAVIDKFTGNTKNVANKLTNGKAYPNSTRAKVSTSAKKIGASRSRSRGRRSLISGDERGIRSTLG